MGRVIAMDLVQRVREGEGDFLLFGITPPKASTPPEKLERIREATLARLRSVDADGVALYDIAEEQDRNPETRPFPFLPTLDPSDYLMRHLTEWRKPAVIYRAVGKYTEPELRAWLEAQAVDQVLSVFVGASSRHDVGATSLQRAYEIRREVQPELLTGAVLIPERHTSRGDEHRRMLDKQAAGVSFFVSQILYDANAAKNLLADYVDECEARGAEPKPVVFTLSVCGSVKTLDFLTWLGVKVPQWVQRDLRTADNPLDVSCLQSAAIAADVLRYGHRLGIPVGLNVESVSSRRVEIEAAVKLATDLRGVMA